MSSPPRKRIVINLSEPQEARVAPGANRRKRWPKVVGLLLAGVGVIILGAFGAGYFWWRHYQTTPAYSLALLVDAAQRNDMAAIDRLVDGDKVAQSLWPQVTEKAASQFITANSDVKNQLDTLAPTILPRLKDNLNEQLVAEIRDFSAPSVPRPFVILALTVPALVRITSEDDTARVAATLQGQPVNLTMQRDEGLWKVTAFKSDALVGRMMDQFIKELPRINQLDAIEPQKDLRARRKRRR